MLIDDQRAVNDGRVTDPMRRVMIGLHTLVNPLVKEKYESSQVLDVICIT
ncbi:hypothetical protein [Nonomuraea rubra]